MLNRTYSFPVLHIERYDVHTHRVGIAGEDDFVDATAHVFVRQPNGALQVGTCRLTLPAGATFGTDPLQVVASVAGLDHNFSAFHNAVNFDYAETIDETGKTEITNEVLASGRNYPAGAPSVKVNE
jgi:hypothetical protein